MYILRQESEVDRSKAINLPAQILRRIFPDPQTLHLCTHFVGPGLTPLVTRSNIGSQARADWSWNVSMMQQVAVEKARLQNVLPSRSRVG